VILIILLGFKQAPEVSTFYRDLVLAGLECSFCGDVFLMLPSDQFLKGLLSFFAAHVCYIVAFSSEYGVQAHLWYVLPVLIVGIVLLRILLPHTGKMTIPVIVYAIVILLMLWQAVERWGMAQSHSSMLATIGAALFVLSDAILAYNRFARQFTLARLVNLSTYYLAQWLIALSV
jgi:uncharacterized membrane protein YhhN